MNHDKSCGCHPQLLQQHIVCAYICTSLHQIMTLDQVWNFIFIYLLFSEAGWCLYIFSIKCPQENPSFSPSSSFLTRSFWLVKRYIASCLIRDVQHRMSFEKGVNHTIYSKIEVEKQIISWKIWWKICTAKDNFGLIFYAIFIFASFP